MQTINASVILEDAERLLGWDLDQLETRQKQIARTALSLALQEVWESWWWSRLMLCQAVPGAATYAAATAYAVGDFVYYPATQLYYQCVQAGTGHAPATYSGGSWTTNYAYWAEAKAVYSGSDFDSTKTDYALGDIVRNPVDGEFYALHSHDDSIVISDAANPVVNDTYFYNGLIDGNKSYLGANGLTIYWQSPMPGTIPGFWLIYDFNNPGAGIYYTSENTMEPLTPDAVTWADLTAEIGQLYSAPPESRNWGLLTPFVPTCDLTGNVRAVGDLDPRNRACTLYNFDETADGVRIPDLTEGVPWIWYRRATPILTGDDYSATATYTAASPLTYD